MSSTPDKISVLFCCLGNICRSPMAEAAFTHVITTSPPHIQSRFTLIDSCGTASYHTGSSPDSRTVSELRRNGITTTHRARQVRDSDFHEFDYILAMDEMNLRDLEARKRRGKRAEEGKARVMLFGEFGEGKREIVEDPYYGGEDGFRRNFEQVTRMSKRFVREVLGEEV
ncbi:LMWPc-domain-containing protein [Ascodesmis nigricans]|uniref:LMWPc-domain-containing protein n=1 Tax=Ascodesmis nigricans TaxID=341454 RepID=A0A4V3SJX5_9PEZI|nr:LMWPc-domain-containing protein [Ascodesmis nigricans]